MCQPAPLPSPPVVKRVLAVLAACAVPLLCTAVLVLCTTALSAQGNRPDPVLAVATWRGQQVVAGELLVQFAAGTTPAQQEARHAQLGCSRLGGLSATLARVALPAGADLDALIERYQGAADVSFAQPNVLHRPTSGPHVEPAPVPLLAPEPAPLVPVPALAAVPPGLIPSDSKWSNQWNLVTVNAPDAWATYTGSAGAVLAVIDSGVDVDHPDLDGHLAWGLDTYAGDDDPEDASGHGTHCCGIAAAETDNALGVAGATFAGRFASYRCGNSTFPTSALVAAINDATTRGALVLSCSWGSSYNDPAIRAALQAAQDAGCVVVAAAGNDGASAKFYPAANDFVIAVGASTSTDARASFSNWGSWVDVAAPGQAIYSTYKGGAYTTMNGTSMACPLVSGLANLLYARLGGTRSAASAALVRGAIENSAVPVGPWVAYGRVDMAAALALLPAPAAPQIAGLAPTLVPAFHGTPLSVSGSGLAAVTSASVSGATQVAVTPVSDGQLSISMPDATALGPATLTLTGAGGTTASAGFTWVETAPPQLDVPSTVAPGESFTWAFGGGAGHAFCLLIALDPAVFSYAGIPILQNFVVLQAGVLDALGLASATVTVPASAAGITFLSQVATLDSGFSGASAVASTTITP